MHSEKLPDEESGALMLTASFTTERRTQADIAKEWDEIADIRDQQIESGQDVSFHHVLKPVVLDLLRGCDLDYVLDVGCGTGHLTKVLASAAGSVVGIDISNVSVRHARVHCQGLENATFSTCSVQELAEQSPERRFSAIVANMVFMCAADLEQVMHAVMQQLRPRGALVFTVTHPCFWPRYWGYDDEDWFDYSREIFIQAPFRISNDSQCEHWTTHIHRPLERYFGILIRSGLTVERLCEPIPSPLVQRHYPEPWRYPRFLAVRCSRDAR